MHDVLVIGAGLSGLTTAWRLQQADLDVVVVEAQPRLGGRLMHPEQALVDLGASWVWDSETHIHALLGELGVQTFPHHRDGVDVYDDGRALQRGRMPRSHVPERRIVGGAHAIPVALAQRVHAVRLGCRVSSVRVEGDHVSVQLVGDEGSQTLTARHVVAALPPALLARTVQLPQADPERLQVLRHCATWMADTAKVVVRYERRFWRDAGLSGRAASRVGPLVEIHDLSGPDGAEPALFGFVPRGLATGAWLDRVVPQLDHLFGQPAASPLAVHAKAWWEDPHTLAADTAQGNQRLLGHPSLRQPLLGGRLHLVSTETSAVSPGHMDGAVERAQAVASDLIRRCAPARA